MNILFLDIDGVLNRCDGSGLNTDKVALLKEISDATDCRIVMSSSWRLNARQFTRILNLYTTIRAEVIGKTPDFSDKSLPRWREIKEWIRAAEPPHETSFVILDDEADMGPLSHLHVRTDSHTGLTPELAREIISRFNDIPTTPKP